MVVKRALFGNCTKDWDFEAAIYYVSKIRRRFSI
jgi:hypothetical protein